MTRSSTTQSRRSRNGIKGESLVKLALHHLGFTFIQKIETGFKRIYTRDGYAWRPCAAVAGDFRCLAKGGQSVLVESKAITSTLRWAAIRPGQAQALTQHQLCGGLSYIAVVKLGQVALLKWPIVGFGPRVALKWETIRALAVSDGLLFPPDSRRREDFLDAFSYLLATTTKEPHEAH